MKIQKKNSSRTFKRALAFVMSIALAMSTLTVSPSVDAARKKKPKLSVKKKTLYYNKSGKKTYTLKVKKNKVKKIKKTTWKTSNKKVVKISKKKKTSVKLTAKKAGKAKITAIVKYTVKGSKKVRKKKLVCKVTSKKYAKPHRSATPTKNPTVKPTAGTTKAPATKAPVSSKSPAPGTTPGTTPGTSSAPSATPGTSSEPSTAPSAAPAVKEIVLDKETAAISTAAGKNTVTLKATAKDEKGNEIKDASITWKSDKEEIAKVDAKGVVTAVKEGVANVTATAGDVASKACKVTVDATAPAIEKTEITDYQTLTVTFKEAVKGEPAVSVYQGAATAAMTTTSATLAEDGKSLTVANTSSLAAATYKLVINGLTDLAGNALAKDTTVTATKDASIAKEFIAETKEAPKAAKAGDPIKVYYTVKDQYGEPKTAAAAGNGGLTVSAKIADSSYPLTVAATNDGTAKGYVEITDEDALKVGNTVTITLTNKVNDASSGKTIATYSNDISTVIAKNDGLGDATSIEKVDAAATNMTNSGTAAKPVFALTSTAGNNTFTLTSSLLDKFLYAATAKKEVKYVIADTTVLQFADTTSPNTIAINTSDSAVTVNALKAGSTTVTAYLVADASQKLEIPVTIKPAALDTVSVAAPAAGKNGTATQAEVTLSPSGTGISVSDLKYVITSGADACESITFANGTGANASKIYANITAKANGKSNTIKCKVYTGTYDEKTQTVKDGKISTEVTFSSTPSATVKSIAITSFDANEITAGGEATTEYKVLNEKNEDITATASMTANSANEAVATVKSATAGKLTLTGVAEGETTVTLSSGTVSGSVTAKVVPTAYAAVITLEKTAADVIDGDAAGTGTFVKISAKDQYGNDYTLTKEKWDAELKLTNTGLTVTPQKADATNKATGYAAASANADVVKAIEITSSLSVTEDTAKEVKIESKATPAKFTAVQLAVTVKKARAISKIAFEKPSLTALTGVASANNNISLTDQYGAAIEDKGGALTFVYKDSSGKTVSTITPTKGGYDSTKKVYPFTAQGSAAGTYTVIAYVDDDGTSGYGAKDTQASFTLTVGAATALIKKVVIDNTVNEKDLSKVDYIKVAAQGKTATDLTLTYKAYDADGKEIALGATAVTGMKWSVAEAKDVVVTTAEGKIASVTTAANKTTGSLKVNLVYTPAEDVKASITVPVSSAEAAPKAGTYKIYAKTDGKKTDIKNTTVAITKETPLTYVITANDQYGDEVTLDGTTFFSTVSTDESFATVEWSKSNKNEFTITRQATGNGTATIKIFVTADVVYTVTVNSMADLPIALSSANCAGQGAGATPTVTFSDGAATLVLNAYNQGIKVTMKMPKGVSLKDYSGISFKAKAVGNKLGLGKGSNPIVMEMHKDGEQYLQGPGANDGAQTPTYSNVRVAALDENGEISPDYERTITLPFDWTNEANIKDSATVLAAGADVSFVLGVTGKNSGSYIIKDLKLIG